ncbi:MAG: protein kinase, partial [Clostridia bacterium]
NYFHGEGLKRQDLIKLGIDMCRALELCRKKEIIHRDIKPENIFISEDGNFKLGDFGVAANADKTLGGLSKKGTYSFMAPEVYKADPYGPTVDIYSLGIVLYRLLNNLNEPFLVDNSEIDDYAKAFEWRMKGEQLPPPASDS